jgi:ribosome biogenesis protein SSF1/2
MSVPDPYFRYSSFFCAVQVVPVGINRGVKKIVTSKVPNLGRLEDMADLLTKGGAVSESEAEVRTL